MVTWIRCLTVEWNDGASFNTIDDLVTGKISVKVKILSAELEKWERDVLQIESAGSRGLISGDHQLRKYSPHKDLIPRKPAAITIPIL
jgi:hypothetical protein